MKPPTYDYYPLRSHLTVSSALTCAAHCRIKLAGKKMWGIYCFTSHIGTINYCPEEAQHQSTGNVTKQSKTFCKVTPRPQFFWWAWKPTLRFSVIPFKEHYTSSFLHWTLIILAVVLFHANANKLSYFVIEKGAWLVNCYLWCSLNLERTINWVKAVSVPIFTILVSHGLSAARGM